MRLPGWYGVSEGTLCVGSEGRLPGVLVSTRSGVGVCKRQQGPMGVVTRTQHPLWLTFRCSPVQRAKSARLQSRDAAPDSFLLPVVAFTTSSWPSPTVQFTLKQGDFPG